MNMISNIYVKVLFGDHERESADSGDLITSEYGFHLPFTPGSVRKAVISGHGGPRRLMRTVID